MTAPLKLKRLYEKLGSSCQAVAKAQNVNIYWVIQLINETGIEPITPKIRARLFLPKTRRKKNPQATPTPLHLKWWRHLPKEERHRIIQNNYELKGII